MSFRWSLSALGTFEKCAFKYKLKYIERLEENRSASASRGVGNHSLVEEFLKGTITSLPAELSYYQGFLTGLKQHEIYPEHVITLNRKWESVPKDSPEIWYKGVLDLKLIESTEAAVVYDWKTGKIYPDHDDQKSIYSIGVFSEHPSLFSVRAVHVYLDLGQNREKTYHRDQVYSMRFFWERRVEKLERAPEYIPNPGFHCRWCSYSRANKGPCKF